MDVAGLRLVDVVPPDPGVPVLQGGEVRDPAAAPGCEPRHVAPVEPGELLVEDGVIMLLVVDDDVELVGLVGASSWSKTA
jgi:hypothetical protein